LAARGGIGFDRNVVPDVWGLFSIYELVSVVLYGVIVSNFNLCGGAYSVMF